jgi:hypothetical protein
LSRLVVLKPTSGSPATGDFASPVAGIVLWQFGGKVRGI